MIIFVQFTAAVLAATALLFSVTPADREDVNENRLMVALAVGALIGRQWAIYFK